MQRLRKTIAVTAMSLKRLLASLREHVYLFSPSRPYFSYQAISRTDRFRVSWLRSRPQSGRALTSTRKAKSLTTLHTGHIIRQIK